MQIRMNDVITGLQLNRCRYWFGWAKAWLRVATVLFVTMPMASVALGQTTYTPTLEIAAGYQSLQRDSPPEYRGWFVSAARPLTARFSIVGEFADVSFRDVRTVFVSSGQYYTYLAGIRYAFPAPRVRPFVQVLAGAVTGESQSYFMRSGVRTSSFANTRHTGVLQPGAGMDIPITQHLAARVAAHAFTLYDDGASLTRFRFAIGVVFGFGNR